MGYQSEELASGQGKTRRNLIGDEAKPSLEAGWCNGRSGEEPVNTDAELEQGVEDGRCACPHHIPSHQTQKFKTGSHNNIMSCCLVHRCIAVHRNFWHLKHILLFVYV